MVIAVLYPSGAMITGGTMCEKESMCEMEKLLDSAAKLVSIFVLAVFLWFCFI